MTNREIMRNIIVLGAVVFAVLAIWNVFVPWSHKRQIPNQKELEDSLNLVKRHPTAEDTAMINELRAHTKESRTKVLDMILPAYAEPLDAADAKLSRNFQVLDDAWAREIQVRQDLEKRVAALERRIGRASAKDVNSLLLSRIG